MHRSGITVTPALKESFTQAQSAATRWFKCQIVDEKIVEISKGDGTGDPSADFKMASQELLDVDQSCYLMMRLHNDPDLPQWLLISYVPELCPAKEKMLYASSRPSLRLELGSTRFTGEFFVGDAVDCTFENWQSSRKREDGDNALTDMEILVKHESKLPTDSAVRSQGMSALPIPVSEDCKAQIQAFQSQTNNFVEMYLDSQKESLEVGQSGSFSIAEISSKISDEEARFFLIAYSHSSPTEGPKTTNFFVYSCPDVANVRSKMFFSSSKSSVIRVCQQLEVKIDKQLEIRQSDEIGDQQLLDELYSVPERSSPADGFARPKRPGKGRARIMTSKPAQ